MQVPTVKRLALHVPLFVKVWCLQYTLQFSSTLQRSSPIWLLLTYESGAPPQSEDDRKCWRIHLVIEEFILGKFVPKEV